LTQTNETKKIIVCDTSKCNGCQICEYVCSVTKERTINPKKARIRVVRVEPFFNVALTCRKCEDPPCVKDCPMNAIRALPNGSIAINEKFCDGCGWCIESCRFGAMRPHPERRVALVCDFCAGLDEPQCVKHCPKKALKYTTLGKADDEKDYKN